MTSFRHSLPAAILSIVVIAIAYGACCLRNEDRWVPPRLSRAEFNIGPLRELGYSPETIRSLVLDWTSGPWMELDGDGGRIDLHGDRLVLFSASRNHMECAQVLKWLRSSDEIAFEDPAVARAVAALDRRVTLDVLDAPLWQVFEKLGSAIEYPFCIHDEGQGWPNPNERVQVSVVDARAWDVCRGLPSGYFPFQDHIGAVYVCMPVTPGMKLQVHGVRAESLEATRILARELQESTSGPWENIDGDGGRIRVPKAGVLLVTAEFGLLMETRDAWRTLRAGGK